MEMFQKGDNSAFDELFSRYKQPLLGYLDRYLANPATAEDVFQQAFLTLWTKRDSYKGRSLFKTWLYAVATNLARDTIKHRTRQKQVEADMELIPAADKPESVPTADPPKCGNEALESLKEVVEKLPIEQRECFVLARYQGLSYREIAGVCNCSLSAVKMRLHRALKTVTESLAGGLKSV